MDGAALHHWDRRYGCRYYYGRRQCTPFYSWGRWVVVGVIIFLVFLFALLCCLISRRRRRKGMKPMYGTGWAGKFGGNKHHNNHQNYNQQAYPMNNNNYNYGNQPPAYGQPQQPQHTGSYFNSNDGYYGQQQYPSAGYPQQPAATYQQQQGVYSPPPGPPPGK